MNIEDKPFKPLGHPKDDLLKEARKEILFLLGNDLSCDHSVGVCYCSTRDLLNNIAIVLGENVTCSTCGGFGVVKEEGGGK